MPLESAAHINQLVASNPDGAVDTKSTLDDHIRMIKLTLRTDLPNIGGTVSASHTELSYVTGVTSAVQAQINTLTAADAAKMPLAGGIFTGAVSWATPPSSAGHLANKAYVDGAYAAASTAQSAASNAQTTANNATTAAGAAQSTANTAVTNAATAQSTASAAQTTANAAAVDSLALHKAGTETVTGVKTFQAGSEPASKNICKAWCRFNGTSTGTNAPTDGFNVTSVTRNGLGDYTITFANAMANANYALVGTAGYSGNAGVWVVAARNLVATPLTTTTARINTSVSGSSVDAEIVSIQILGG